MCVDSGVHYEPDRDDVLEVGELVNRDFGDRVGHGPQLPVGRGPVGGVAPVWGSVAGRPPW